jgi:hypothetical protein
MITQWVKDYPILFTAVAPAASPPTSSSVAEYWRTQPSRQLHSTGFDRVFGLQRKLIRHFVQS